MTKVYTEVTHEVLRQLYSEGMITLSGADAWQYGLPGPNNQNGMLTVLRRWIREGEDRLAVEFESDIISEVHEGQWVKIHFVRHTLPLMNDQKFIGDINADHAFSRLGHGYIITFDMNVLPANRPEGYDF